jgi:hypothetical protein
VHHVLPGIGCIVPVDAYLERVVLVLRSSDPVAQHGQPAEDRDPVEPGLLVELSAERLLGRLAGIGTARGYLRPRPGIVALLEHEHLRAPVSLARHVRQDSNRPGGHAGSVPEPP